MKLSLVRMMLFILLSSSPDVRAGALSTDSAAIQESLDAMSKTGGVVQLDAKRYLIDRPLNIPEGVTLAGSWEAPHTAQLNRGTIFEVTVGRGEENGPPAVMLNTSSCVKGITFFYPEQRVPDVVPYPWTIQGRGLHGSVIDCTFVNPYKMIDFGTYLNELHYIRNCYGCPLKIGVHIDQCTDVGRIENVHFNPNYWSQADAPNRPDAGALRKYMFQNLVAFEFGRTDWEYVHNTFCFGARIGYRFYDNRTSRGTGAANGNFLGIGADWCRRSILVEASQTPGLLITNGEFVGADGADAMMEVGPAHDGVVQLNNCSFWGPCQVVANLAGTGNVSLQQCTFHNHTSRPTRDSTIDVSSGHVSIQNCRFGYDGRDICLGGDVRTAIILGNWFRRSIEIDNQSTGDVQQGFNVASERPAATKEKKTADKRR